MRKLLALAAVAAGLMVGSAAKAATVDFEINQTSATGWDLLVDNHGGVALGAINIFVTGLNTFTPNPANTAISGPDTGLTLDPLGDGLHNFLIVTAIQGQVIVGAGATQILLGSFTGPGPVSGAGAEDLAGSPTLLDVNLVAINTDFGFLIHPLPPVPEPATLLMLGLGLGGLALVRRRA